MKLTGENRSTRGETCPSATLSTTNPTWTDPGSNPDLRGGRPAANRLSHGTAKLYLLSEKNIASIFRAYRKIMPHGWIIFLSVCLHISGRVIIL
jgi:hypothetical protein